MMSERKSGRLGYADVLRCAAALAVVVLHCSGATLGAQDPASTRFLVLNILNGSTRWAVPMFLMLTGMFLLDPERPMSTKKWLGYLGRMGAATLIWGFFYALYDSRDAHMGLERFLEALIRMVRGQLHFHLWYLPMLLGFYLLLPPMRALVKGSSRRGLWYLTGLWAAVSLGLNAFYMLVPQAPGQPWYNMLGLYSLSSYMGYLLLGYMLKTCALTRARAAVCYVLGALGLAATWEWGRLLSLAAGQVDGRIYETLTPNVCLMAVALFVAARRLEVGRHPIWAKLSALTFGVYLIHPYLLHLCEERGLPNEAWNVAWAVPLEAAVIFAAALAVSWLLRHVPKVGKYIC